MHRRAWILALTAAVFAVAAGAAQALVIEAEAARVRTAGVAMEGGWNLHSAGEVGDYVRIDSPGTYTVVVRARGTPCGGVWPAMAVSVDQQMGPAQEVRSKEFQEYTFRVEMGAGVHTVAAAFLNDAFVPPEDRNLYLDRLEIRPAEGGKEPEMASHQQWAAKGEAREEAALEKAAQGIEKHRKADATVQVVAGGKNVADARVRAELVRHAFLFGANIYMFDRYKLPEQNATYKKRFRELFNYATVGFYWRWYEPERGKPIYDYTDKVVAWCTENGIRMKGHPLLWGDQAGIPTWSGGQPAPEVQKVRVTEIMRRYSGKITLWEVVNEPSHLPGLKIADPYRWARAADAKAQLIVNDYYVMANGFPPFFRLLKETQDAGVPFDGRGHPGPRAAHHAVPARAGRAGARPIRGLRRADSHHRVHAVLGRAAHHGLASHGRLERDGPGRVRRAVLPRLFRAPGGGGHHVVGPLGPGLVAGGRRAAAERPQPQARVRRPLAAHPPAVAHPGRGPDRRHGRAGAAGFPGAVPRDGRVRRRDERGRVRPDQGWAERLDGSPGLGPVARRFRRPVARVLARWVPVPTARTGGRP